MSSWIVRASGPRAKVRGELVKAQEATVADGGVDSGVSDEMVVAFDAVEALVKVLPGRGAVEAQAAGSSHEGQVSVVVTVSRVSG